MGGVEVAPAAGLSAALVLRANNGSTAWVEQPVTIDPGAWYEAGALLAPVEGVRAGWVRIAWYASSDASGAQMSTVDSQMIGVEGLAILGGALPVTTGPVQAPSNAQSARVRILLQPSVDSGAALAITQVSFEASQEPAPVPTPSPTPAATATPTSAPSSPPVAATSSSPLATPSARTQLQEAVDADLEGQALLRITEVMPDAIQTGRDADYEWVELTNLGERAVDLAGMVIRDAQQGTALSALVVAPGASVVIAASRAEVDADARIEGAFGNGLGNEGDRLDLVDASGRVVDALEYGSGTDLVPVPGESVHRWFSAAGALMGAAVGPPSPGLHEPLEVVPPIADADAGTDDAGVDEEPIQEEVASSGARSTEGPDAMAWMLLIAVGGGALGGVAAQRIGRS